MDDRQLTIDEQFLKITTTESNDEVFMSLNTNPIPDFEKNPDGDWVAVKRIRYTGAKGKKNQWRLR